MPSLFRATTCAPAAGDRRSSRCRCRRSRGSRAAPSSSRRRSGRSRCYPQAQSEPSLFRATVSQAPHADGHPVGAAASIWTACRGPCRAVAELAVSLSPQAQSVPSLLMMTVKSYPAATRGRRERGCIRCRPRRRPSHTALKAQQQDDDQHQETARRRALHDGSPQSRPPPTAASILCPVVPRPRARRSWAGNPCLANSTF